MWRAGESPSMWRHSGRGFRSIYSWDINCFRAGRCVVSPLCVRRGVPGHRTPLLRPFVTRAHCLKSRRHQRHTEREREYCQRQSWSILWYLRPRALFVLILCNSTIYIYNFTCIYMEHALYLRGKRTSTYNLYGIIWNFGKFWRTTWGRPDGGVELSPFHTYDGWIVKFSSQLLSPSQKK